MLEAKNSKEKEKGHLLEIHLLEKSARQQNLDCSTPVEQIEKKKNLLEKNKLGRFCLRFCFRFFG
jgi:hypothetical protein